MKVAFDVNKVHLYIAVATTIILLSTVVVVATGFSGTQASHATLFTDTIRGRSGGTVAINDNLNVNALLVQYTSAATDAARFRIRSNAANREWDMAVRSDGANVGHFAIGDITAADWRFDIDLAGNAFLRGVLTQGSDIRLKTDVTPIDHALDKVSSLEGVYYRQKEDLSRRHIGLIAQDVESVIPEAVATGSDGMKSIAYTNMVGLLVSAIKELDAKNARLQALVCKDHHDDELCR